MVRVNKYKTVIKQYLVLFIYYLNAEDKFREWVIILGIHITFKSNLIYNLF